jgi:Membrane domain of glycerophosphoryl diester phosphodiesterase
MTDQPEWEAPEAQAAAAGTPIGTRDRPLPLRQMGIGEIIDGAVKLYRRDFLALIGIVAFVLVPVTFAQFWVTQMMLGPVGTVPSDEAAIQFLAVTLIFFAVQFLIIQPFLVAAVARAASDAYLGEPVGIGRTYRYALSRLPAILWITVLTSLLTIIGFILLIIPGIIAFVRLALAPPVLVVEDVRGTQAVRRSWRLTSGNFWRLLGLLVLSTLIATVGVLIITIPTELLALLVGPAGWPISALGSTLATVLITPFSMLIIVLFYFDMRIRKEGFDIEMMAQELAPTS